MTHLERLNAESSKLVFFSDTTSINKPATGTPEDLTAGKQITVIGQAGDDNSLTAQNIQIRQENNLIIPQN